MKKLLITFFTLFLLCQNPVQAAEDPPILVNIHGSACRPGLYQQPGGAFAVMVFCEDAQGSYIGVVCPAAGECSSRIMPNGDTRYSKWEMDNRFWQDQPWADDVNSFAWLPDGKSLLVATNAIYGSGAVYRLFLEDRKAEQILPIEGAASLKEPSHGYAIDSIDGYKIMYLAGPEYGSPFPFEVAR